VQGEDNTHYLNYSWDKWWNPVGSIYLDYRSSQSLTDFHTIIYGHRMYDDSMFNSLKKYRDPAYLAEHPSVYILTEDGVKRYDVFSAYDADVTGPSWRLGLEESAAQQTLFNFCMNNSVVSSTITPTAKDGDKLLTLSTCSQTGDKKVRWVVHCVLSLTVDK
jgi:sortase B